MTATAAVNNREQSAIADVFVAFGLALGPVVALGFSRFAYALLLPPMRADLGWTYVAAGGMNTANAIGYVLGAGGAALVARYLTMRWAFVGGMIISGLALLATAATADYWLLMAFRAIGGFTTAVTFVVGSSLAAGIRPGAKPARSAALLATYFAGVGIGIVLSGLLVPAVLSAGGSDAWRTGWLVLGALAVVAIIPSWIAARAVPPLAGKGAATLSFAEFRSVIPTFIGYAVFGAGYVSYMTFIIALLNEQGVGGIVTTLFWVILGAASALSTLAWGPLLGRMRGGRGPALVSVITAIGALPVLLWPGETSAFASAIIFGGSFMAGPTAVTVLARRVLEPTAWTAGISILTVAFALGQAVGPLLSGTISDATGLISSGLWLSPVLLVIAASLALLQQTKAPASR